MVACGPILAFVACIREVDGDRVGGVVGGVKAGGGGVIPVGYSYGGSDVALIGGKATGALEEGDGVPAM